MVVFEISFFIILLLFSAYFSSSETALFSLNRIRISAMKRARINVSKIEYLLEDIPSLLSTIIFVNMCVNIAFSSTATAVSVYLFGRRAMAWHPYFRHIDSCIRRNYT